MLYTRRRILSRRIFRTVNSVRRARTSYFVPLLCTGMLEYCGGGGRCGYLIKCQDVFFVAGPSRRCQPCRRRSIPGVFSDVSDPEGSGWQAAHFPRRPVLNKVSSMSHGIPVSTLLTVSCCHINSSPQLSPWSQDRLQQPPWSGRTPQNKKADTRILSEANRPSAKSALS